MTDPIRIFVGTDQRQGEAEKVLEYSVRKHTNAPVEFTWMREGDAPHYDGWKGPKFAGSKKGRPTGWYTSFSTFRMIVAELCGFEGKAIYLDSDMMVLGDIQELWDLPQKAPYLTSSTKRTEVGLIQCDQLKGILPPIEEMKKDGRAFIQWRKVYERAGVYDCSLPSAWNVLDKVLPGMKLLHFTSVPTQPWKPWPEYVNYGKHRDERCVNLWREYLDEAERDHAGT